MEPITNIPQNVSCGRLATLLTVTAAIISCGVVQAQVAPLSQRTSAPNLAQSAPQGSETLGVAHAPTPVPWGLPSGPGIAPSVAGGSFDMLTRLQEKNVLLDQELKIAQKEKALEQLQSPSSQGGDNSSGQDSASTSLAQLAAMGGATRVLLVEGRPGSARAMIALPSGGTIMVNEGDLIPHVGQVVAITADTVKVRSSTHKVTVVPFWNEGDKDSTGGSSVETPMPPPIPSRFSNSGLQRPQSMTAPAPTIPGPQAVPQQ